MFLLLVTFKKSLPLEEHCENARIKLGYTASDISLSVCKKLTPKRRIDRPFYTIEQLLKNREFWSTIFTKQNFPAAFFPVN